MTGALHRAAVKYRAAEGKAEAARARLRGEVRAAFNAGVSKSEIHAVTGISRPTIDKWVRD